MSIVSTRDHAPEALHRARARKRARARDEGRRVLRVAFLTAAILLPISVLAADIDLTGRVSPQFSLITYPDNSAFEEVFGSSSVDSAVRQTSPS